MTDTKKDQPPVLAPEKGNGAPNISEFEARDDDEMQSTRKPHLHLVGPANLTPDNVFNDPEKIRYRSSPEVEAMQPKLQRRPGRLFAQVELAWLIDPRLREHFPAHTRLYLYLQIKSIRGSRSVRLTNEMTADIGLDRRAKWRCLRSLEAHGLVRVVKSGKRNPEVAWLVPSLSK